LILIPIRDENPTRRRAWVTGSLVAANLTVFLLQLSDGDFSLVQRYGFVPATVSVAEAPRLFTSMFLHGGILHILGNLVYLWVFGNNIEDVLGPVRFTMFYVVAGLGGHAAHFLSEPSSAIPTIGASGAISGLLAAYWIRFPKARVHTLLFLFILIRWVQLPAAFVIGYWLLLQILNGLTVLGGATASGVAWFEHLGGFAVGAGLFVLLGGRRR
jgi:membrane associated rhomboid family serine protease